MDRLRNLLTPALRQMGAREQVREAYVKDVFAELVGPALSGLCEVTRFYRGTLVVASDYAPLSHQLHLERDRLIAGVNARLGDDSVKRMRFIPRDSGPEQKP